VTAGVKKSKKKKRSGKKGIDWDHLYESADAVIRQTLAALPEEVRAEAVKVPCLLEKWPDKVLDPDTLGICAQMEDGMVSNTPGPIVIYLGTVHEYAREEGSDFLEEVEATFLHEIGHHLGWDEDEIEVRGL